MHYLDTSVLVTLLTAEPATPGVRAAVADFDSPVISDWTVSEFASALSLKARVNSLPVTDNEAAHAALRTLIDTSVDVLPVSRSDFQEAADLCRDAKLVVRAGDALHLAIARAHGLVLVTRDRGLQRAAELSAAHCLFLGGSA